MDDARTDEEIEAAGLAAAAEWEAGGVRVLVDGHQIWGKRIAATTDAGRPPLLVIHGYPTCSFDWNRAVPILGAERDVIVLDLLGFGLSDKPDVRYSLRGYADGVEAIVGHFGVDHVDLVTHDLGDSVGGEILARSLEGSLEFTIGRRALANGSIYIEMAHLTAGQQFLLELPDERNPAIGADGGAAYAAGVIGTFAAGSTIDPVDRAAFIAMAVRQDGLGLLARTIRYIEDRRAEQERFTGAIERHPSPVGVVWGDQDPVAIHAMAERFVDIRTDAPLITLDGVGHYPMIEAPERFADAVVSILDG